MPRRPWLVAPPFVEAVPVVAAPHVPVESHVIHNPLVEPPPVVPVYPQPTAAECLPVPPVVETPRQPTPPLPTAEHAPHHSFEPQPPPCLSHSTQESTSVENIPVTTEQPLAPVTVPAETPVPVEPSPAIETPSIPVEHPTIAPSEPVFSDLNHPSLI